MSEQSRPWTEPTLAELERAIEIHDHIVGGGKPRDPIENGLRLARRVGRDAGMVEDHESRPRTIAALARIVQVDDDVPKARVNSLMAARMVLTDLSLQRDAAIAHDLDVLDRTEWWSAPDVAARRPAWTAMPGMSKDMRSIGEDPDAIEAIARGELHMVRPDVSAVMRDSMEGLRSSSNPFRADLDLDIAAAAGLMPPERIAELRTKLVSSDGRYDVRSEMHKITRQAVRKDRAGFPEPYGTDRELSTQSSAINFRIRDNNNQGHWTPSPVTDDHRKAASRALLDAQFSNPETSEGRAVRVSLAVLRDLGMPERLLEGPGFERTLADAVSRSTDHQDGWIRQDMATRNLVAATVVRNLASVLVEDSDSRFRGHSEEKEDFSRVVETTKSTRPLVQLMFTQSERDLPDLRLVADGRFDEVGDSTGMRMHLANALMSSGFKGELPERIALVTRDMKDMTAEEPLREAPAALKALLKGPKVAGSDWVEQMASMAKGVGRA